jgi:predicted phosphodiesterase
MKIALISDVHANLPALEAALSDVRAEGVDATVFLGDAATLGPCPRETLGLIQSLGCPCILGNHDEAMLEPARAAELQIGEPLLPSLEWSVSQLTAADADFLRTFRPTRQLDFDGASTILCYHASPLSNTDILLATTPEETVDKYFESQSAAILAGGHTHIQMLRKRGRQVIVNPGSVGNAFEKPYTPGSPAPTLLPWAEYAILRAERGVWSVDLRRVPFDTEATRRLIAQSGNPSAAEWLRQYR